MVTYSPRFNTPCSDCAFQRSFFNIRYREHDDWCDAEMDEVYYQRGEFEEEIRGAMIYPCKRGMTHEELIEMLDIYNNGEV